MKIICTQENLKAGLAIVGRIVSSSNSLPILNNVLLKTENGMLSLSATNLEIAVTTKVRCKIEEEGEVTILCRTMSDLVNNLPNKNITLQSQSGQLDIEAENYHTSIKTLPAEEFPLIPQIDPKEPVRIGCQELKAAFDQVVFAASTSQTQPEISGVLLSANSGVVKTVATDRYRLAERKIPMPQSLGLEQEVIIPQKTVLELSRIIGSQKGEVEIILNETQISFCLSDTQVISRLVDGQYPPYEQIIPTSFNTTIVTEKQPLINALRAGGIFSQGSSGVRLEYNSEKQAITLVAESQDLGKNVVDLPSKIEGESGVVMLNYHYMLDCLSNIGSANVVIRVINDSSAAIIVPEDQAGYLYLVMPIKG